MKKSSNPKIRCFRLEEDEEDEEMWRNYLQNITCIPTGWSGGDRFTKTPKYIEFIVGAVIAIAVEAIAAITAILHGCRLLFVVLLDEILHHLIQANWTWLQVGPSSSSIFAAKLSWFSDGNRLLNCRNSQNARKRPIEKSPQSWFEHRLGRLCTNLFSGRLNIDINRLDLHRKRHDPEEMNRKISSPSRNFRKIKKGKEKKNSTDFLRWNFLTTPPETLLCAARFSDTNDKHGLALKFTDW